MPVNKEEFLARLWEMHSNSSDYGSFVTLIQPVLDELDRKSDVGSQVEAIKRLKEGTEKSISDFMNKEIAMLEEVTKTSVKNIYITTTRMFGGGILTNIDIDLDI